MSTAANEPTVELTVPAETAYATIIRSTVGAVVARAGATLDSVDDARVIVGEMLTLLLEHSAPGERMSAALVVAPGGITLTVRTRSTSDALPDDSSFAWTILTGLATDVHALHEGAGQDRTLVLTATCPVHVPA